MVEENCLLRIFLREVDNLLLVCRYLCLEDIFSLSRTASSVEQIFDENGVWKKILQREKNIYRDLIYLEKRYNELKCDEIKDDKDAELKSRITPANDVPEHEDASDHSDDDQKPLVIVEQDKSEVKVEKIKVKDECMKCKSILLKWLKVQGRWNRKDLKEIKFEVKYRELDYNYTINSRCLNVSEDMEAVTNTRYFVTDRPKQIKVEEGAFTTLCLTDSHWIYFTLPSGSQAYIYVVNLLEDKKDEFSLSKRDPFLQNSDHYTWHFISNRFLLRFDDVMECSCREVYDGDGNPVLSTNSGEVKVHLVEEGEEELTDKHLVSDQYHVLSTNSESTKAYLWRLDPSLLSRSRDYTPLKVWKMTSPISFPQQLISSTALQLPFVLIGMSSGKVLIYNVSSNSVIRTLFHDNKQGTFCSVDLIKLSELHVLTYASNAEPPHSLRLWKKDVVLTSERRKDKPLIWKKKAKHRILDVGMNSFQILAFEPQFNHASLVLHYV